MRTIEIVTAQKVPIQYSLASLRDRILGFIVDITILWIGLSLLTVTLLGAFGESSLLIYFIILPILLFYSLFFEAVFNGQTPGKMALGIKVVKLDGEEPTFTEFLIRWAFRLVDIYFSLGVVASVLISSSNNGQRLGDVLASTTLIKLKPRRRLSIKDLLSIKTTDNYEPAYPKIAQFKEEDMLFVKEVIDRYEKYKNKAHQQVLTEVAHKMARALQLKNPPQNQLKFLKTLLNDYVILTR